MMKKMKEYERKKKDRWMITTLNGSDGLYYEWMELGSAIQRKKIFDNHHQQGNDRHFINRHKSTFYSVLIFIHATMFIDTHRLSFFHIFSSISSLKRVCLYAIDILMDT